MTDIQHAQANAGTATPTEHETHETHQAHETRGTDAQPASRLGIAPERAAQLRGRWTELRGHFVDEPRNAVHGARDLTGDVLDELERSLREHHTELSGGIGEKASTEQLRVALGRYQKLCERLLAF